MTFKLIKAGVAALALLAVPFAAQAADMPIKGPYYKGAPRSVVSYYNWTGFYAGVNAGYGFGTSTWSLPPGTGIKPKGWLFGGTLGYNWQSGAIVYGLEGDFDWSDVKGNVACGAARTLRDLQQLGSPRSAAGSAMPSIAGCPTSRRRRLRQRQGDRNVLRGVRGLGVQAASSAGPSARGLEYAFLGNWTAKLEYLYVDLGSFNAGVAPAVNNISFKENIVRAGLNYKFSGPIFSRF